MTSAAPPGRSFRLLPAAINHDPPDGPLRAQQTRRFLAAYYASVSFLDAQAGALLEALDRLRAAGERCARLVVLVDLYPTLVELCGLPAPAGLESLARPRGTGQSRRPPRERLSGRRAAPVAFSAAY